MLMPKEVRVGHVPEVVGSRSEGLAVEVSKSRTGNRLDEKPKIEETEVEVPQVAVVDRNPRAEAEVPTSEVKNRRDRSRSPARSCH